MRISSTSKSENCDNTMGKRKGESGGNRNKKYKTSGFIDPNTSGVYASCNRGREQGCRKELLNLISEKIEEWYPDWEKNVEEDEVEEKDLSVEEKIQKELEELKKGEKSVNKDVILAIDLGCECLVFVKIRRPIELAELIERLCQEAHDSKVKNTRYTQKLTPISFSVSASMDELKKLAEKVLKPHFHKEGQEPVKFAIQVTRRNFNTLEKDEIIKTVANSVGRDHGHTVDLKQYDKLIMVECYKNNIGMSVVSNYLKLEKFNLQQIFEKNMGASGVSRVAESKSEEAKVDAKKTKAEENKAEEKKVEEEKEVKEDVKAE